MAKKSAVVLSEKPVFQTYYNRYHKDVGTSFDLNESLTDQDYKFQTDIDYLLEHMAGHSRTPIYGIQDNSTFEDWSNEMALVKRRFLHLSAEERAKFENPQKFLQWCSDPNNYKDKLPLVTKALLDEKNQKLLIEETEKKETRLAEKIAKAIKG